MRKNELPAAQRSFAQPAACLHVPTTLTPEPAKREARKRRASERHAVGCSEKLGSGGHPRVLARNARCALRANRSCCDECQSCGTVGAYDIRLMRDDPRHHSAATIPE